MTDDDKLKYESEVNLASMGKQVLGNAAYKQAFDVRRAQIFDVFCRTSKDQEDIREEAWRTMKNLDALDEYFRQLLETGKMAEITLESNNITE